MTSYVVRRGLAFVGLCALMSGSYLAGAAQSAPGEAVAKLNQSVDFLVKAKAIVESAGTNRQGYGNVQKAKADIDDAINEIDKAVKANGG